MTDSALVYAPPAQANAILAAGGPMVDDRWPAVVLGPMTTVEVATLVGFVLKLDEDTVNTLMTEPTLLSEEVEDGPWLYDLPRAFTQAVRELDQSGIERVAKAWADSEELAGYDLGDVVDTVQELVELVQREAEPGAVLLHWCEL
jgi:hypothetical protein